MTHRHYPLKTWLCGAALLAGMWGTTATNAQTPPAASAFKPCHLDGMSTEVLCGSLSRPLNPAKPTGRQIDIHYAVLPSMARNKLSDPVVLFAGGPGQSALALAPIADRLFKRLRVRRDVLLIDQRGTGKSVGMTCKSDMRTSMTDAMDTKRMPQRMQVCKAEIKQRHKLSEEDLTFFTTEIASADVDAIRQHLGYGPINAVGGSYGTRAALDYLRQYPQQVRRALIDGVAPSDMVLMSSVSADAQAAFDALLASCEGTPPNAQTSPCAKSYPKLRENWQALLASLPKPVRVVHPLTFKPEQIMVTQETLVQSLRTPLYAPQLAAALPFALAEATEGRFEALLGLSSALGGGSRAFDLAWGMHFSVVCAEDFPRMSKSTDAPGKEFGTSFAQMYADVCAMWPQGPVSEAFYQIKPAQQAVLVMSGGADPVTPPRHGERAAKALGAKAKHVVAPNLGHGVMGDACGSDVLVKFFQAATDDAALAVDSSCLAKIPRPFAFVPPGAAVRKELSKEQSSAAAPNAALNAAPNATPTPAAPAGPSATSATSTTPTTTGTSTSGAKP
jgi:pimeloyl-ACP methyl ester carboxylesterase